MSTGEGRFVWYELMTTDTAAAIAFYEKVIGWKAQDSGVAGMNYSLLMAGESRIAGLMALPEAARANGARPGWVGYVGTANVDATAKAMVEDGGHMHHPPTDIPNIGRFAVMADPQGAVFCLFSGQGEPPPAPEPCGTGAPAQGHAAWRQLMSTDPDAGFAFYARHFGWTKGMGLDMGPAGTYQLFKDGGEMDVGGMMPKPPEVPMSHWTYFFAVDSIAAAEARGKEAGATVIHGPMEVPGGMWVMHCLDPQGAAFAMVGPEK